MKKLLTIRLFFLEVFATSLVLSVVLAFAFSANLYAATITVTNGNDNGGGSLRQAIADAHSNDVIVFNGVSTVTLTSDQLEITTDLTIDGGSGVTVTRDTTALQFRIFKIRGAFVNMSNLTISNGYAASGSGGGILVSDPIDGGGTLLLKNSTISHNTAGGHGGGIYGELSIENSTISYNTAGGNGGGIYGRDGNTKNNTISNNTAGGSGGGIYGAYLGIENSIISHNTAEKGNGGGIAGPDLTITHSVIRDNTAKTGGDDSVGNGGGIYLPSEGWIVTSLINSNHAEGNGGGIYFQAYNGASITNSTISDNSASGQGGGIYGAHSSPLIVTNCILWGDTPSEISADSLSNLVVTYSDVQGGYGGAGNIDADPHFVDAANRDFHLSDNSPCIGAGTLNVPNTDIEGNPRPNPSGSNPDMGAYENENSTNDSDFRITSGSDWLASINPGNGWTDVGFDDSAWINAYAPYPAGSTTPQDLMPGTSAEFMWYWDQPTAPDGLSGPGIAYFRYNFFLELTVNSLPLIGQALMSVDDDFDLYVNGELILDNHDHGGADDVFFVDFTSALKNGENVLAIRGIDGWSDTTGDDRLYERVLFDGRIATVSNPPIPEPSTLLLLGSGLIGVLAFRWRRLRR